MGAVSGGASLFGLLGIIFIVLKLIGVIDWAWRIVLSPIWGVWLLTVGILLIYLLYLYFTRRD